MNKLAALLAIALLELGCILHGAVRWAELDPPPGPILQLAVHSSQATVLASRPTPGVGAMLARPLFTPGRVPQRPDRAPPPPPEPVTPPRLTGLIVMEHRRKAIFAGKDGQTPVVVGEGDRLGPFTVTAITPDGVNLAGPLGSRMLRPAGDAALRSQFAARQATVAWIDPARREAETESNQ